MLQLNGQGTLQQQIYETLRQAILCGDWKPGHRLPSTRQLASDLSVSRNSVLIAFDNLTMEGYIENRPGSGAYVCDGLPEKSAPLTVKKSKYKNNGQTPRSLSQFGHILQNQATHAIQLATNIPRNLRYDFLYGSASIDEQSHSVWRRLITRHVRDMPTVSLGYASTMGYRPLRETLCEYLHRTRGVECHPDQLMITNGSRQAIYYAAQILLDPGTTAIIEDPHYLGAREIFTACGATLHGVTVDELGMQVESLFESPPKQPRLVYVTPSHQFPSGGIMPIERRLALLDWANQNNTYIIEDDYDCEYGYKSRPIEAMQAHDEHQKVIYVGTFSKVLFPGLRIGYVVIPEALIPMFRQLKWLSDRHTAILQQKALSDAIQEGHFERHLRRNRTRNLARRKALIKSLETYLGDKITISGSHAGMHLLVWLNDLKASETDALIQKAAEQDVGLYSINPYYFSPPSHAGLLFGYGSLTGNQIHEGIKRLAKVLD